MSFELLLLTLGYFLFFVVASYSLGSLLTRKMKISLMLVGVRIMIGLGFVGNIGLLLGLLGEFKKTNVIFVLVVLILGGLKEVFILIEYFKIEVLSSFKLIKTDILTSLVLVFSILVGGSLYLSAMSPPHATDELHYHFPQARSVATTGKVNWSWDGHYFFGNIPKLMEVVFAEGLLLSDYSLAHALNYLFLLGFLILVYGLIKDKFGYKAAVFSIALLLLFEDLTWNATVGFVDSATTALEVGALLLVAEWLCGRKDKLLILAGLLLGLGLGMKYSPLPTALYLSIVVLIVNYKKIYMFGLPALVSGGYWYIKNLILFGNPFYPMYFGHTGVNTDVYLRLMNNIWQWEPKTLHTFLDKLKRWWTYSGSTTYVSIWLAPLTGFVNKKNKFLLILTGYYVLYIPYWFFFATHQTRFLLTGLVVASILTAILFSKIPNKILLVGLIVLGLVTLNFRPYEERNLLQHYFWIKFHVVERQYALGNISEREFLKRKFGCQYEIIDYLNSNHLLGNVIDNWSAWHAPSVSYFAKNIFSSYDALQGIDSYRYLYVDESVKERHISDLDPVLTERTKTLLKADNEIEKYLNLEYQSDDCKLYEININ